MKFRTRLVVTLSAATAVTMASAFGAAFAVVKRSEQRQLDEALRVAARLEAGEMATQGDKPHVTNRGGPKADDIGRLTKFAVIYDEDGSVVDATPTFARGAPPYGRIKHPPGTTFNFWHRKDHLRGVFVEIPAHEQTKLLLAAPRSDMEKDNAFLRQVMLVAALLSIGFTVLVTWRVVRRLTRGHEAIASAARRVADGDLAARVTLTSGDDEVVQLARDVDEMVRRLELLVQGQRRFIAHAAHELRSPLTSLYGELQLALRKSRSADEYRDAIEEAIDSARRLNALAEDLLALARLGAEQPSPMPVELDEVAKAAASWGSREAARRNVELAIDVDNSTVLGHANDLERLLRNLLDNAIRHSPDGGHVRVEARRQGETVRISVIDEGPGVTPEERDRVFDPFFRAASERRRDDGSGLGLAIVREIARGHGGEVYVEPSPDGRGARFCTTLPAAPHT